MSPEPRHVTTESESYSREVDRVSDLRSYGILDSPREESYDHIVSLARMIAGTPVAYITFIETHRLWFKSVHGLPGDDLPREQTYCQFVVESGSYLLIEDAWRDDRFQFRPDGTVICCSSGFHPYPNERNRDSMHEGTTRPEGAGEIRFYLGMPLRTKRGTVLGTLCVADFKPRSIHDDLIDGMECLAGQVMELLELRRANAALEAERETFTTLFEVAPVPLVLVADHAIRRSNHIFASLVTDKDTDALEGVPVDRYLRDVPEKPGEVIETDLRNELGDATPVNVYRTRLKIHDDLHDLLALNDISDRREKERILRDQRTQAENAARIKDTFLSLVSHDLKSPLSGIYSMLDLLAKSGNTFSEEARDEAILDLRSSAALLMEMINQLLNIHRLESGQLQVHLSRSPVRPIAQDVLLSLARQMTEKQVTADIVMEEDFSLVMDEGLFREALFNLVANAVKFSPLGSVITIEADNAMLHSDEEHDRNRDSHGTYYPGGEVRVVDKGAGVPEEDLPNLFKQEVKTSRPGTAGEAGTGLGLPLVRDIMRAHGGDVHVRYTGIGGSCFVLTLPARRLDEEA